LANAAQGAANQAEADILKEQTARIDADGSLSEEITTLVTSTENNASSIQQETQSRSDDDSAQGLIQKSHSGLHQGVFRDQPDTGSCEG